MSNVLYNNFEPVSHTLDEFTDRLSELYHDGEYDAFIRAGLTGEYRDEHGRAAQIFLDPVQNMVSGGHELFFTRDYDSALGFSQNILVNDALNVYSVPHPSHALKTSIHLTWPVEQDGHTEQIALHHIPNFEFGTFGVRHHLHIFFPKLCTHERRQNPKAYSTTPAERAFWYERAFRPAIEMLLGPGIASEWPATYETEEIRARKSTGGHAWGSKIIPAHVVPLLMDTVRSILSVNPMLAPEDITWAREFLVLHTIRGVKQASLHEPTADDAEYGLDELFRSARLTSNAHLQGKWWVDVGIEATSNEGSCLQWTTASHRHLVQHFLDISESQASKVTRISCKKYYRDLASHLTDISGFRLTLGRRSQGKFQAAYMQAYTTDKAVVYNPDGSHHAKFVTAKEAFGPVQPCKTIEGIHTIYEQARNHNSSKARLEIRVPSKHATSVLVDLDYALLYDSLCVFTREEWWNFRIIRLQAISQTLTLQQSGPSKLRFFPDSLLLTASCLWLVNGLHARPDDGPASRDLMRAALPITERSHAIQRDTLAYNVSVDFGRPHDADESEEEETMAGVPYNPYGCVFLRRIMLGGEDVQVPRFRVGGPQITPSSFQFLFNGMTVAEIQAKFQTSGILDKKVVAEIRSTTNKRSLVPYINHSGRPEQILFQLGAKGFVLSQIQLDAGSDMEDMEDELSPRPNLATQDIDTRLSTLWRQFVMDVLSKSPNPRGMTKPSHVRLNDVQRRSGDETPFQNLCLPEVFNAVWYKRATSSQWQTSFDWLFPPPGRITSTASQNYHTCLYYRDWMELLDVNQQNPALINEIRKAFWQRLRQWAWIPYATSDKMWMTSAKKACSNAFTRWPTALDRLPAPHILLHAGAVPDLSVADGPEMMDNDETMSEVDV